MAALRAEIVESCDVFSQIYPPHDSSGPIICFYFSRCGTR